MKKLLKKPLIFSLIAVMLFTIFLTGCKNNGRFCTLEEAYENGFLSAFDLQSIHDAFYAENSSSNDNKDKVGNLNFKMKYMIRKDYYSLLSKEDLKTTKFNDIVIIGYYGTYNGCVVIGISNRGFSCDLLCVDEVIGGVPFKYVGNEIIVWIKNDK